MIALPNFFIVGAAKAGTTTIYAELKNHPDIYLPANKEPMFFSSDEKYSKGLGWYSENFFKNSGIKAVRGEATPHYLYWAEKVAPRLRDNFPAEALRFIVILRDPVERAYSWYWNMVREGNETLEFEQAVAEEPKRLQEHDDDLRRRGSMIYGYLKGSMYAEQLQYFYDQFPRENILVLLHDDLETNYRQAFDSIFGFLNVSRAEQLVDRKQNKASMPRSRWFQEFLTRPSGLLYQVVKPLTHRLPPGLRYSLKKSIKDKNLKETAYIKIEAGIERELKKYFQPGIKKLEGLIQRDLSSWYHG
jgi:hypothetical protein